MFVCCFHVFFCLSKAQQLERAIFSIFELLTICDLISGFCTVPTGDISIRDCIFNGRFGFIAKSFLVPSEFVETALATDVFFFFFLSSKRKSCIKWKLETLFFLFLVPKCHQLAKPKAELVFFVCECMLSQNMKMVRWFNRLLATSNRLNRKPQVKYGSLLHNGRFQIAFLNF